MKRFISRFFRSIPRRIAAGAIFGLAVLLPVGSMAAETVTIEGSLGVANVTAGDTQYKDQVNATYDQVVKVQAFYHNRENPDSGKIAENLRVKIDIPTTPGTNQVIHGTINGTNTNTINDDVTVKLDRADAYLEYIPGSAVWKHNTGTNENPQLVEQKISDNVVLGGQGLVIENEKPCYNFAATVTVLARVRVPGVKIVKQVRVKGSPTWTTSNTANPGDTLEYLISYTNTGNSQQKNVVIRDNLPPKMTYVPGTTYLANQTNPNGVKYNSDNIATGGIVVGDYGPSANAFVKFEVKIAPADQLTCGMNEFRNVGVVRPEGMNEFFNTAMTQVTRTCDQQPVYLCNMLNITKDGRVVTISDFSATAVEGATFKDVIINWGDGSATLTTTNPVGQKHTYPNDGNYTVSAQARFTVGGVEKVATSVNCAKPVAFTTTPGKLPDTGAGSVFGIFASVSAAGAIGHRLFWARRSARGL